MSLPIFNTSLKDLSMMQTNWASQLNPLLSNPIVNGLILKNIPLSSGSNVINHTLGRNLQGWVVTRMQNAFAELYDTQNINTMPNLTLFLHSNAAVVVDLLVF
jgi:hypothetical protein